MRRGLREEHQENKYVSVVHLQMSGYRTILDTSFAEWSKKNAKTFMSVIYNKTGQPCNFWSSDEEKSDIQIFITHGKLTINVKKDIVEKFKHQVWKQQLLKIEFRQMVLWQLKPKKVLISQKLN